MVKMHRSLLAGMVLAAMCGTQVGCLESLIRDRRQPYSPRTAGAYPAAPPPAATAASEQVRQYLRKLGKVTPADADDAPVPVRYDPASMPLLPLAVGNPGERKANAFGLNGPTRQVTFPAAGALPSALPSAPPSAPPVPPTAGGARAATAPQGLTEKAIANIIAQMTASAEANPADLDLQLRTRLLLLAAGRDASALQPIAALGQTENARIAAILRMMMTVRDRGEGQLDAAEATSRLAALETLRKQLIPLVDLKIPAVKLCRGVKSYGVYETFATNTFPAGRSQPVIVYCELKNFAATVDAAGMYHTKLSITVGLYDAAGQEAQPVKTAKDEDVSANCRTDFFLTRVFTLGGALTPGEYTLKIVIEDLMANKAATATVPIVIK